MLVLDAPASLRLVDHPLRHDLAAEAHARPFDPVSAPSQISYIAFLNRNCSLEQEHNLLGQLCAEYDVPLPDATQIHYSVDVGMMRIKWARHSEFSSYTFTRPGWIPEPFVRPALSTVPAGWLQQLPGQVLVAAHAALLTEDDAPASTADAAALFFDGQDLIGSEIGEGAARVLTDFRIHSDGFSRYLLVDRHMGQRQAGRMLQRLFEIDTYRMMAFLALPLAKSIAPELAQADRELAELTNAMTEARLADEPQVLDRLTQLAARVERALSMTDYRFSASHAYYDIVRRRIEELREVRIQGIQPFHEFMERRLRPAMDTCQSAAARQRTLAERVNRASALLRTRVDISRERQNQALLSSMNRRAHLQLRLQETVEGLSVAAITYYAVALIGYLAKGLKVAGVPLNTELVMATSIPLVAGAVYLAGRALRRKLAAETLP
ncbi:putative membrane-anchored protein [Silvimonas terrae]|uniref:Putative membrane-anchored protein n=1 Tax=Silvimonas terrae TaxID=300266 RepID=A0A840RDP5_9NEIS|nr:DUF3422 domain-containing protein [Silvimonas terrae]MBB5191097.1 putative membrane-anchored protein [Silvimonas terrae]